MVVHTDISLNAACKAKREELGESQSHVGEETEITQSVLSKFEAGMRGVLSPEKMLALCGYLGVRRADYLEQWQLDEALTDHAVYCPNPDCGGGILDITPAGDAILRPIVRAVQGVRVHCSECGTQMKDRCRCGQPPSEGAFCARCGQPYVRLYQKDNPDPTAPGGSVWLKASLKRQEVRQRALKLRQRMLQAPLAIMSISSPSEETGTGV